MGAHYRKGSDPSTDQDFEIERIIMHESYKKPFGMSHDIALLKLRTPAELTNRVAVACLPDKMEELPIDDISMKCWITGENFYDLLRSVEILVTTRNSSRRRVYMSNTFLRYIKKLPPTVTMIYLVF